MYLEFIWDPQTGGPGGGRVKNRYVNVQIISYKLYFILDLHIQKPMRVFYELSQIEEEAFQKTAEIRRFSKVLTGGVNFNPRAKS